ncbi:WD40/YVTN/BNR-like repeat-containing protein [Halarchaeum sp. P4]|uniref:WD40/YVTN/BNR-like repeat-containing protein n=1 Tax=Halarchaeum sp. P4 TaxID=3421639 RepID=UPI003EB70320
MTELSRRDVLRAVGTGVAASTAGAGTASAASSDTGGWQAVESPTDRTLTDVAHTAGGTYAVGGGGVVIERESNGKRAPGEAAWRTVTANGPDGNGSNLAAAAATDDGTRLWVVGASGALAELDVSTNEFVSYRAPDDVTNEFTSVAVSGSGADAAVHVGDASGHVHVSTGSADDGRTWTHVTPGSGASVRGLAMRDATTGALVDANGSVFETTDGTSWERVGVEDVDGGLYDVTVTGGQTRVAGGALHLEADGGWGRTDPTQKTLYDIEMGSCGCIHAVGAGGTILHRPGHDIPGGVTVARWLGLWDEASPVETTLHGVVMGDPHVAVGANGTIVER